MADYHLHFYFQGQAFDADLTKVNTSGARTVMLNGIPHSITVQTGDENTLFYLLGTQETTQSLTTKLAALGATNTTLQTRVQSIASSALAGKDHAQRSQEIGAWKQEEHAALTTAEAVAKKYWERAENHDALLAFLKGRLIGDQAPPQTPLVEQFEKALATKNKDAFIALFKMLSRADVTSINFVENLGVISVRSFCHNRALTDQDKKNLEEYLRDTGFQGVVSVTSGQTSYSTGSTEPFCIYSLGKVFTGMLLMTMIQEGIIDEETLDKPIQLEEHVHNRLPKALHEPLKTITLRQVMTHTSGLGDYLGGYLAEVQKALDTNGPLPNSRMEDMLQYADTTITALKEGEEHYSNVGSLLFGLALQYHYNKNHPDNTLAFGQILQQHILKPAGITSYSETRPNTIAYNPKDPNAYVPATPAGGQWMTADDLQKFGQWIAKRYQQDNNLLQLLEKHGREFYSDGCIEHLGAQASAGSAYFSTIVAEGATACVLTNQERLGNEFAALKIHNAIMQNILTEEPIRTQKEQLEFAYQQFKSDFIAYCKSANLGQGALMIQITGIDGAEGALVYGPLSTKDATAVDVNTIGRTGSGAKLWAALLTKIMVKNYSDYITMNDKLEKFVPVETLRKFGNPAPDGTNIPNPELAREITVEAIVAMTAGLEYDDKVPKEGKEGAQAAESTLDQLMRGPLICDGAIHFVCDPRDKIAAYSNNIMLAAYPIEKAYKKVLAKEHFPDLSITLQATSKADRLPPELLQVSLNTLLKCQDAYIHGHYVYDLIDLFLSDLKPSLDNFTYADIMQKELLKPLGMSHSGFQGTKGVEMARVYTDPTTDTVESTMPHPESAAIHAAGYGRTTLHDASILAQGLADPIGLKDKKGTLLLSRKDLDDVFSPHGQYTGWGLGATMLTCNGAVIEKGGSIEGDTFDFWVDRQSGVGMIAMCNCGKRPIALQNAFKTQIEEILHPGTNERALVKEGMPILMSDTEYLAHPLRQDRTTEYFEGTRGKIAIMFDWQNETQGIMHWSGTPFHVEKIENDRFRITTPGRYQNIEVQKVKGAHTQSEYLLIGDTSFTKTNVTEIPTDDQIKSVQALLPDLVGDYINPKRPEWGIIRLEYIEGNDGTRLPTARWLDAKNDFIGKKLVPLGTIKVTENSISFNGHDRDDAPPDKIYRFKRNLQDGKWQLEVTDCASSELIYEAIGKRVKTPI